VASVVSSGSGYRHLYLECAMADANESPAFFRTIPTFGCSFSSGGIRLSRVWNREMKIDFWMASVPLAWTPS